MISRPKLHLIPGAIVFWVVAIYGGQWLWGWL